MRPLAVALAVAALAGCQPSATARRARWTLFADDARLAAVDGNGQPWCATLRLRVTARLADGPRRATPAAPGPTPSWQAPLLSATEDGFARGLSLDVLGQCDTAPPASLGAVTLRPSRAMIEAGGVALARFGSVARLRLHFAVVGAPEVAPPSYSDYAPGDDGDGVVAVYEPPVYCEDGGDPYDNCGAWPTDTSDDPGAPDPNAPDPGAPDPTGSDPGAPTDPPPDDPGVGSDPGSGNDGSGDGSSDDAPATSRKRKRTRQSRTTG
jgi:hypothetical protein